MPPAVSIVTPAHNAAPFIEQAWASIRAQSFTDWEWLVVDDASTDDTAAIVRRLAAADPRIRLTSLRRRRGHAGRVRNVALRQARGAYIAFLDADDLWEPEKLELQLDHLRRHPGVDVVCTWISVFGDPERAAQWSRMLWRDTTLCVTPRQIVAQSMPTSSILFRRRCYDEMGGMDPHPALVTGEDTEFGIRLATRYEAHRIRLPLTRYRVAPLGASLSTVDPREKLRRALALHRIIARKQLLPSALLRLHLALTWYNEAKNNLFHHGTPWRGLLLRSLLTGAAPPKAWVMALLAWMPDPLLRRTLEGLLSLRNRKAGA